MKYLIKGIRENLQRAKDQIIEDCLDDEFDHEALCLKQLSPYVSDPDLVKWGLTTSRELTHEENFKIDLWLKGYNAGLFP